MTMALFHRKLLNKSMKNFMVIIKKQDCALADHCEDRQPPPPSPSVDTSLSPLLILMFCGLAVSFTFICYLTLSRRCRRERNPETTDEVPHEVFFDRDFGPVTHHPMWLINSVGLNQSEIESIDVFKYKKDEKLIQGTDCSVCLSEFQDDESLRLLPKCSHAFHVPCIDTWLRSHTNCPLCRAPIFKNSNVQITDTITDSNLIEESEDSDQSIELVEAENDREVAKTSSGMRVCSDLADRLRVKGQESVVAMRRSVSMNESSVANIHRPFQGRRSSDRFGPLTKYESMAKGGHKRKGSGSSSSISIRIRAMKRSSFGHSSRKASGFTKDVARLGSYNRSY